jgi:hypothetical protein
VYLDEYQDQVLLLISSCFSLWEVTRLVTDCAELSRSSTSTIAMLSHKAERRQLPQVQMRVILGLK